MNDLIDVLTFLLGYLLLTYLVMGATYIFYVAIMEIKRKWNILPRSIKVIVAPWVFVGIILDFILSVLATPILGGLNIRNWQFAWLLTGQLKKHKARSKGRSLRWSAYICAEWLNHFDDNHC